MFSTFSEVFGLLVVRFHTTAPRGLSEDEREDWVKSKQRLVQVRVINIMKQLILDDELFNIEEKAMVIQSVKVFALSVQDDVSAAKLLVRAADRLVRSHRLYDFACLTCLRS
jgi:hypothetical protein